MEIRTACNKSSLSEYWEAFLEFLGNINKKEKWNNISQKWFEEIKRTCIYIERIFSGKRRKSWEEYVSHLYEVARNFIELHGEKICSEWIMVALLHDSIEDIESVDYQEIKKLFWWKVAFQVQLLSKPKVDETWKSEEEIKKLKQERNEEYFRKFKSLTSVRAYIREIMKEYDISSSKTWDRSLSKAQIRKIAFRLASIKLCDRIHNLETMDDGTYSVEKIQQKWEETRRYFMDLALELWRKRKNILRKISQAKKQKNTDIGKFYAEKYICPLYRRISQALIHLTQIQKRKELHTILSPQTW